MDHIDFLMTHAEELPVLEKACVLISFLNLLVVPIDRDVEFICTVRGQLKLLIPHIPVFVWFDGVASISGCALLSILFAKVIVAEMHDVSLSRVSVQSVFGLSNDFGEDCNLHLLEWVGAAVVRGAGVCDAICGEWTLHRRPAESFVFACGASGCGERWNGKNIACAGHWIVQSWLAFGAIFHPPPVSQLYLIVVDTPSESNDFHHKLVRRRII